MKGYAYTNCPPILLLIDFFKKAFTYLKGPIEREREREHCTHELGRGEAGSPLSREPDERIPRILRS